MRAVEGAGGCNSRLGVLGAAGLSSGFASSHFESGFGGGVVVDVGRVEVGDVGMMDERRVCCVVDEKLDGGEG